MTGYQWRITAPGRQRFHILQQQVQTKTCMRFTLSKKIRVSFGTAGHGLGYTRSKGVSGMTFGGWLLAKKGSPRRETGSACFSIYTGVHAGDDM